MAGVAIKWHVALAQPAPYPFFFKSIACITVQERNACLAAKSGVVSRFKESPNGGDDGADIRGAGQEGKLCDHAHRSLAGWRAHRGRRNVLHVLGDQHVGLIRGVPRDRIGKVEQADEVTLPSRGECAAVGETTVGAPPAFRPTTRKSNKNQIQPRQSSNCSQDEI